MTYAEMKGLGYGTVNERLGKVSSYAPGQRGPCYPAHRSRGEFLCRAELLQLLGVYNTPSDVQVAVGNYYDCRLTLRPAVVSTAMPHCPTLPLPAELSVLRQSREFCDYLTPRLELGAFLRCSILATPLY